ncbi:FliM/FliN family flagellar motor C-terminal domain-containing protein [Ruegeria faecimaris]|uniref:Flagellar motor switch protein FliM n=1 Tax=Ruegeria faecimaris TaxID=686389 RepID=A0A521E1X0_9RHOB|nr:FliM/FliN family flagellar motor C-terminal domain-containing protein [Ruegeria faecimaris]SMO77301.1 flagellar motor switch protein FliM [Ruegeria faecimaris]
MQEQSAVLGMTQSVSAALARKLSISQEEKGDKPRSILRALRLAFARAAEDRLQMPLSVIGAKQSCRPPGGLTQSLDEEWILLLFSGSDSSLAAICMDIGLVSAVVQAQTIGEVMPGAPSARGFTDTDAAMVSPWIEEGLSRAASLVETASDRMCLIGFEYASRLADLRTLTLAMVEEEYRVFELTVELGGGLRQGQLSVLLPIRPAETAETEVIHDEPEGRLDQASGVLRADLNTVVCRMPLSLATLTELVVGDVLPLIGARLDRTEIVAIDRSRAAIGRLGQCGGLRAVRLNETYQTQTFSQPEANEFLEASSASIHEEGPTEHGQEIMPFSPGALGQEGTELNLENSEHMVAEISQLAGLSGDESALKGS